MTLPEIYHINTKERYLPVFLLFKIQMIKWGWPKIPKRLQRWEIGGGVRIPLETRHIKVVHRPSLRMQVMSEARVELQGFDFTGSYPFLRKAE